MIAIGTQLGLSCMGKGELFTQESESLPLEAVVMDWLGSKRRVYHVYDVYKNGKESAIL